MDDLIKIKNNFTLHDQIFPESHHLKVSNNNNKTSINTLNMRPFFLMTLENDKNQQKLIKIFEDSDPAKLAFNFCLENQMDYETMLYLKNNIEKVVQIFKKNEKLKNPPEIHELDEESDNLNIKNNKKERMPYIKKNHGKNYKFSIFDNEVNKFTNDITEGEESSTERGVPELQKSISNNFNTYITNNEINPTKTINISHKSNSSYNFNVSNNKKDILQTYLKTLSPKLKKKIFIKKNKISISDNNKNKNLKIYKNHNTLKTNYIKFIPKNKKTIQYSEMMQRPKHSGIFSRKESKKINNKNNSTNYMKKNTKPEIDIVYKNHSKVKTTIHSCKNKSKIKLNKDYKDHIKNNNTQIWNTLFTRNDKKKLSSEKNHETYTNTLNNSKRLSDNMNELAPYIKNKFTYKKIHSSYSAKNEKVNINNRNGNNGIQKCESKYKLLTNYPTVSNFINENINKNNKQNNLITNNVQLRKIKHRNIVSNDFFAKSKNFTVAEKKDSKISNIIQVTRALKSNNTTNSTDSFFYNCNNNSTFQNNIINFFNKIFSLFDKDKNGIIYFNGNLYQQFKIFPSEIRNILINMFEKLINDKKFLIKINRVAFIENMLHYFNGLSCEKRKILIKSENKINEMIKKDLFEYYKPKNTYSKFEKNINFN